MQVQFRILRDRAGVFSGPMSSSPVWPGAGVMADLTRIRRTYSARVRGKRARAEPGCPFSKASWAIDRLEALQRSGELRSSAPGLLAGNAESKSGSGAFTSHDQLLVQFLAVEYSTGSESRSMK